MLYFFIFLIVLALSGMGFIVMRKMPHYLPQRRDVGKAGPSLHSLKNSLSSSASKRRPSLKFPTRKISTGVFKPNPVLQSFARRDGVKNEGFWIGLIQNNPQNPYPYKKLGELYLQNKQLEEAREAFGYALRLAPQDETVKRELEKIQ